MKEQLERHLKQQGKKKNCLKKANQASQQTVTNRIQPPWPSLLSGGKNMSPGPDTIHEQKPGSSQAQSFPLPSLRTYQDPPRLAAGEETAPSSHTARQAAGRGKGEASGNTSGVRGEQLSPSANTKMAAGRTSNTSPALAYSQLAAGLLQPRSVPGPEEAVTTFPRWHGQVSPISSAPPTAGGPQASGHQAYKVTLSTHEFKWTYISADHTQIHDLTFIPAALSSYRFLKPLELLGTAERQKQKGERS